MRKQFVLFVFVCGLVAGCVSDWRGCNKLRKKNRTQANTQNAYNKGNNPNPSVRVSTQSSPSTIDTGRNSQSNNAELREHRKDLIALGGAIIALFGLAASVYSSRNSSISAQISTQTLYQVQRAFVFVKTLEFVLTEIPNTGQKSVAAHPFWENSGATPTKNLTIYSNAKLINRDEIVNTDLSMPGDVSKIPVVLGPKQNTGAGMSQILKDDYLSIGHYKKPDVVIYGQANYLDQWDHPHVTMFCFDVQSASFNEDGKSAQFASALCPKHNCADEECKLNN